MRKTDREMEGYRKFVIYTPFIFQNGVEATPERIEDLLTGNSVKLPKVGSSEFISGTVRVEEGWPK